jgi:phospholipid transport system transporter-binding protein
VTPSDTEAGDTGDTGAFVDAPDGWHFEGALTMENAAAVLEASAALPLPPSGRVDLAGLSRADSSALAVTIALRRRAHSEGRALRIENLPAGLQSLAAAYGIDALTHGIA